jgi:hypothetical protein
MVSFVIDMHIGPLDIGQALEFDLQFLCNIVGSAQSFLGVHDDVDFDNEAGARVVGADRVDLADEGGVCHCCVLSIRTRIC